MKPYRRFSSPVSRLDDMRTQEKINSIANSRYATSTSEPIKANLHAYYSAKRIMDLIMAFCLLIFLLPIMILIGLAIFIYSPGPIFFVQERVGAKRRLRGNKHHWELTTFHCYKFRTMKINADSFIHREYVRALIENDHEQTTRKSF